MKFVAAAVAALGIAQSASAGVYDLSLRRVALGREASRCESLASDLAASFARLTGARVLDHGCRRGDPTSDWLEAVLTYEAPARVAVTSTFAYSVHAPALYTSREDCEAALEEQKAAFAAATDLEPMIAYCVMGAGLPGRWATSVDGVGTPRLAPDTAFVSIWGTPLDAAPLAGEYRGMAEAFGLAPFEAGLVPTGLGRAVVVRYFADDAYSLDDYDDMTFARAEECLEAAQSARDVLAAASKPVVTFCEAEAGRARLHVTTFKKTLDRNRVFGVHALTRTYPSAAACQAAAHGLDRSGGIFGGVCAEGAGGYQVHVFHAVDEEPTR